MFLEGFVDFLTEIAVALVIWGLAVVFPFRRMAANEEFRWDIVAVLAATVFSVVSVSGLYLISGAIADALDWWYALIGSWSIEALIVAYLLFADFVAYWAHRLLHTNLMWHSHAFHHSPRHLYVLSGTRASLVHIVILFAGPTLGLELFPVYESVSALLFVTWLQILNQHVLHSNLKIPFARYLEYVFVTPRFHFVHHSVDRKLSDSNFGFIFSFWDRLFATYTDPQSVKEEQPLGLAYENSNLRLLLGLPPAKADKQRVSLEAHE